MAVYLLRNRLLQLGQLVLRGREREVRARGHQHYLACLRPCLAAHAAGSSSGYDWADRGAQCGRSGESLTSNWCQDTKQNPGTPNMPGGCLVPGPAPHDRPLASESCAEDACFLLLELGLAQDARLEQVAK